MADVDRPTSTFDDVNILAGDQVVVIVTGIPVNPPLLVSALTILFTPTVSGGLGGFKLNPPTLAVATVVRAPSLTGGSSGTGPGGTPAWLVVSPDTEHLGMNLLATGMGTTGTLTVNRITAAGSTPVRGLDHVTVTSANYGVIDTEMPLDTEFFYELRWTDAAGTFIQRVPDSGAGFLLSAIHDETFILRDLFSASQTPLTEWILGVVPSEDINVRGGIFPIIGRPDPVVVVDVKESTSSVLNVITLTRNATNDMRNLLNTADPLLVQIPAEYGIGDTSDEGVLYLQPTKTTVRRPLTDARRPERVFEISYTQVSPPPASVVFGVTGTSYRTVQNTYVNYRALKTDDVTGLTRTYFQIAYGSTFGFV
jgi:hypothetical protein